MIATWEQEEVQELPTFYELMEFIRRHKYEVEIHPQFLAKFQSVWQDDIQTGYQFAELLLEIGLEELMWKFDISQMHLANQILQYNPNHTKALKLKLRILVCYHDFNLHELPWGVLVEGNLDEELQSVQEMESIANKLNFHNECLKTLIDNSRFYYPLWFEYLKQNEKNGFKSFLNEKGIDVEKIVIPYTMIR